MKKYSQNLRFYSLLWLIISTFLLSMVQLSTVRAAEILASVTYADCNTIEGRAFDADNAGAPVDVIIYIRLINNSEDFAAINASGNFSVSVPGTYKDPFYDTIFTVIAAPFTPDQTTVTQAESLGACGSSGGGGGSSEPPSEPVSYTDGDWGDLPTYFGSTCGEPGTYCTPDDFRAENNDLELVTPETEVISNRLIDIINFLSAGVGIVVTGSVAFAGIQYITSRGVPAYIQKATNRLWQAGLALFLYIFGWALLNWLVPGGLFNQ